MHLQSTPFALLVATALIGAVPAGYAQQVPAQPAAQPDGTARLTGRLTGMVADGATGKPIAYASVAVLNAAGTPVSGGACGGDGQFVLVGLLPGTYTVRVSFLGYQELARPWWCPKAGLR